MPALLAGLGRAGLVLRAADTGGLGFTPRSALTPDRAAALIDHRRVVLGLLAGGYAPAGDDAGYVLGERLGMADVLGMPTIPGSAAWLVEAGESMEAEHARAGSALDIMHIVCNTQARTAGR